MDNANDGRLDAAGFDDEEKQWDHSGENTFLH